MTEEQKSEAIRKIFKSQYVSFGIMAFSTVGIFLVLIWELLAVINNVHMDLLGREAAFGLLGLWAAFISVLLYITLDFARDIFFRRKVR
jgi:uncharacterized PurR-regulated membrane protein YhhQ (DUF165 family)